MAHRARSINEHFLQKVKSVEFNPISSDKIGRRRVRMYKVLFAMLQQPNYYYRLQSTKKCHPKFLPAKHISSQTPAILVVFDAPSNQLSFHHRRANISQVCVCVCARQQITILCYYHSEFVIFEAIFLVHDFYSIII